jgi:hypothetical protein
MKLSKSYFSHKSFLITLIALISVLVVTRLVFVVFTPPGFFLDEAATGAHVVSMLHEATNAHGTAWPLFSESLGGGYTTPIYLYPLVGWATVFGTSELSLRYFSVTVTLFAIALISAALSVWLGRREALIAAAAALALPWGWLQGSLAWDPALVPFLVGLAFISFTFLYQRASRADKYVSYAVFPLSLIALAYLYPPARVTAPLLFIAGYTLLFLKRRIGLRSLFVICLSAAVISLPLLQFMLQPAALERTQLLSVFHNTSLVGGLWQTFVNALGLMNPLFLFATGDPNLRHSTGVQGMLGIAAVAPLLALTVTFCTAVWRRTLTTVFDKKTLLLLAIAVFGYLASILGSALTNESQPHSLRATAAWPFTIILIVLGWRIILAHRIISVRYIAVVVFLIGTIAYAADLSLAYPARAASSFDVSERTKIDSGQPTPGYPNLALEYYIKR